MASCTSLAAGKQPVARALPPLLVEQTWQRATTHVAMWLSHHAASALHVWASDPKSRRPSG